MRKFFGAIGACVGLGIPILKFGYAISNVFSLFSLPSDVRGALIVLSGIPSLFAWAGLAIGLVCAGYLIVDSGHHAVVGGAIKKRMPPVEPIHVIILGLVIVTAGVVWQVARPATSQGASDKTIAGLQRELKSTQQLVATLEARDRGRTASEALVSASQNLKPAALPTTRLAEMEADAPQKQKLTAYDIEQRQRAIDELYGYLNDKMLPVSAAGEKLNERIFKVLAVGSAVEELDKYTEDSKAVIDGYFAFAAKYMYFPDIYEIAVSTSGWSPTDVPKSAGLLRGEIQELHQRIGTVDHNSLRNNKLLSDFQANMSGKFWTWINQKKEALTAKRRFYEKAEVYSK